MVVDSWPLLERSRRGTALDHFEALLDTAAAGHLQLLMSEVNLGEYFYLTVKDFGVSVADRALASISKLPITIAPLEAGDGMRAARLKAEYSISLADCFCASLAIARNAAVITGDPDFVKLHRDELIHVDWLGA